MNVICATRRLKLPLASLGSKLSFRGTFKAKFYGLKMYVVL